MHDQIKSHTEHFYRRRSGAVSSLPFKFALLKKKSGRRAKGSEGVLREDTTKEVPLDRLSLRVPVLTFLPA